MAKLFFSYSHKDEDLRNQLEVHLAMLKREGVIELWHDHRVSAGDEFDKVIAEEMEKADVMLLLISPDFLASSYCYDVELTRAIQRHDQRLARVIPVILRSCDWRNSPFSKLKVAPKDGKPVTKWPDRDDAFLDVVDHIRGALETAEERYLINAFEVIARYLESSLNDMEERHDFNVHFRRSDDRTFDLAYYDGSAMQAGCVVRRDGSGKSGSIAFVHDKFGSSDQPIEITVSVGGVAPSFYLKPIALTKPWGGVTRDSQLTPDDAARCLWALFGQRPT
jgi:TIR domain